MLVTGMLKLCGEWSSLAHYYSTIIGQVQAINMSIYKMWSKHQYSDLKKNWKQDRVYNIYFNYKKPNIYCWKKTGIGHLRKINTAETIHLKAYLFFFFFRKRKTLYYSESKFKGMVITVIFEIHTKYNFPRWASPYLEPCLPLCQAGCFASSHCNW